MSWGRLPGELELRVPSWLRTSFLITLALHDVAVIFAGAWGLRFEPAALAAALGETWIDDVWGWLFVVGGLLCMAGAISVRPTVETVGCLLVFGAYTVLGVATITSALFGDYSAAGGVAIIAGGIGSLRRIGRVWAGAYLRGQG